jgi:hypothetical protein
MDMTKEIMATYIGTLRGILDLIDNLPSPSVKKIRKLIEQEIKGMRMDLKGEEDGGQD